jgi:hypothetical protein
MKGIKASKNRWVLKDCRTSTISKDHAGHQLLGPKQTNKIEVRICYLATKKMDVDDSATK